MKPWLLPSGMEEELPEGARHVESLRRKVLAVLDAWGYDLVIPPLIEYLESLLITGDEKLDLDTFKLTDHLDGRTMGIRADMTPQVTRIDVHRMPDQGINRLCYMGTVLRARPTDIKGVRSILQFGAEIYGDSGSNGDVEVMRLMLESLKVVGISDVHVDIGHIGIYLSLVREAGLDRTRELALFRLVQTKAQHEIRDYLHEQGIKPDLTEKFLRLVNLHGGVEVLDEARKIFSGTDADKALAELGFIAERLDFPGLPVTLHYDLAELGGYHYKSGVVFAAFIKNLGQEIARGGRYDELSMVFGSSRRATGFSSDLALLASLVPVRPSGRNGIFAPCVESRELQDEVARLRHKGYRVVEQLNEKDGIACHDCDRIMVFKDNQWRVEEI